MNKRALYLIGVPGSGKSTLIHSITAGLPGVRYTRPCEHIMWGQRSDVLELGGRRPKFSGTDTLSMSVKSRALELTDAISVPYLLAEGDRLANGAFFDALRAQGWVLDVIYLATPLDVAAKWRAARAEDIGKDQSAAWVQGRITKVEKLASEYAEIQINAVDLEARKAALIEASPVAKALVAA